MLSCHERGNFVTSSLSDCKTILSMFYDHDGAETKANSRNLPFEDNPNFKQFFHQGKDLSF